MTEWTSPTQNLLSRPLLAGSMELSPLQSQVDGLTGAFVQQALDWRALAAITAGGLAYRAGRLGAMDFGSGNFARTLSIGAGLTAELSALEWTHGRLQSNPPRLWRKIEIYGDGPVPAAFAKA